MFDFIRFVVGLKAVRYVVAFIFVMKVIVIPTIHSVKSEMVGVQEQRAAQIETVVSR